MATENTNYPGRYYASYDLSASQPTRVTAWYDTWDMSTTEGVPLASDMIVVTPEQWANPIRAYGWGVHNGSLITYKAPSELPLSAQASSAYSLAVATVQSEYTVLNEATPAAWVAYLKALKAIRDGTDTTSTALPAAPSS